MKKLRKAPMKYTIEGFAQDQLIELQLDVSDALILRWFIDFAGTGNMKRLIHDHQIYYYVKYSGIISDLPVLGITSTKGIGKRFDRYVEKGLLLKTVKRQGNGTILFFAPTRKLLELQYNCTKGTTVPFVESPSIPTDNFIQNELDFEGQELQENLPTSKASSSSDKKETEAPHNSMKGTTVPFSTKKRTEVLIDTMTGTGVPISTPKETGVPVSTTMGTPVSVRKEPQFPSERNSSGHHFKTDYSTKNSSTTDSLTTKPQEITSSLNSAVAVLKNAFGKKIPTVVFSPDFWEKTASFLTDQKMPVESIPRYVDVLFDYAQKNNPRNLPHYLYKTAATAFMVAEFQAQAINHSPSAEVQEEKRHRCTLCNTSFIGSQCPECKLKVKDFLNENALREAKIRYRRKE